MLKEQTPLLCWYFVNMVSVWECHPILESCLSFCAKIENGYLHKFCHFCFQNLLQWNFLWTIENVAYKFWFSAKSHIIFWFWFFCYILNLPVNCMGRKAGTDINWWVPINQKIITQKGKQLEASNFSKIFPKDRQLNSWILTVPSFMVWKKMACKNKCDESATG